MKIIITSPSLDTNKNVTGISAVTKFIIDNNRQNKYIVFELGRRDDERRDILWFFRILGTYLKWLFWMLFKNQNLIHFNIALEKPSIIRDIPLILIGRLFQKKIIIHLHGGYYLTDKKIPFWIKGLLKLGLSEKFPKIVLSSSEKIVITKELGLSNLFVLSNCVDLKDANEFTREFDDEEPIKLLFLSRISDKKGIEYIYKAFVLLKKLDIKFKFTLAGKGPDEMLYVEKFSDLLKEDFVFKGVVSGEAKTQVLKENNIFLLPSFFEGLPMALLESMSFGLVPITTNVGSIKHVITDGENGIFVNRFSAEDIVVAIQRLYVDKDYKNELSQNARRHIIENFKAIDYVSSLNKIYRYE